MLNEFSKSGNNIWLITQNGGHLDYAETNETAGRQHQQFSALDQRFVVKTQAGKCDYLINSNRNNI